MATNKDDPSEPKVREKREKPAKPEPYDPGEEIEKTLEEVETNIGDTWAKRLGERDSSA